jgi:hypothetical protein
VDLISRHNMIIRRWNWSPSKNDRTVLRCLGINQTDEMYFWVWNGQTSPRYRPSNMHTNRSVVLYGQNICVVLVTVAHMSDLNFSRHGAKAGRWQRKGAHGKGVGHCLHEIQARQVIAWCRTLILLALNCTHARCGRCALYKQVMGENPIFKAMEHACTRNVRCL